MTEPLLNTNHTDEAVAAHVPSPGDPAFGRFARRSEARSAANTFGDDVWAFHEYMHSDNQPSMNFDFGTVPSGWRLAVKVWCWNVLNTPPQRLSQKMKRPTVAPSTVHSIAGYLRQVSNWAIDQGIHGPAAMTSETWNAWALALAEEPRHSYDSRSAVMGYISRTWCHNVDLPADVALTMPPWFDRDFDAWLGPRPTRFENLTEPLPPDVMADLLSASLTVIDAYLGGTSGHEYSEGPHLRLAARRWALAQGMEVPSGKGRKVSDEVVDAFVEATGYHTPFTRGDVRSAALVVIAYLTGMRPQEVLHLQRGCLSIDSVSAPDGSAGVLRYRISGMTFKNVLDGDGVADTGGRRRQQPWVTIEPVSRAVRALEQLAPDSESDLFVVLRNLDRQRHGRIITSGQANVGLRRFIERWNVHAARPAAEHPVPNMRPIRLEETYEVIEQATDLLPVTDQTVTEWPSLSRFRRTLAWHIANRPGGEVALGVQYGHIRRVTLMGYAGRAESGFPDELDLDLVLAGSARLADMVDELQNGEHISGPAADRLTEGLSTFAALFEGRVRTEAEVRRFKQARLHTIYDNPLSHVVCVFNPATAACLMDARSNEADQRTPDLSNCRSTCANIAVMDHHIEEKARQRDALLAEVDHLPEPLADRNRERARRLQLQIDNHNRQREDQPGS